MGELKRLMGWGSPYFIQSSRICWNQLRADGFASTSVFKAKVLSKLWSSEFGDIQGVLDSLGKKESGKFMRHTLPLVLCLCLLSIPVIEREFSDIKVQSFGQKRTS